MTQAQKPRIKDVAEKAGVSSMTVSRVLNKDANVSDQKTKLVLKAIKALNYQPNIAARRLASNKSFLIGLLYFDIDTSYVSKFLLRCLKSCRATGHNLVADEIDENVGRSLKALKDLVELSQVDGIILLPPLCDTPELLDYLKQSKIPFVRIAPDTNLGLAPYICMNDYLAAFEITELLIKQGHKKIGHITGNPNQGVSRLRYQGYLDALRSNQINVPPEYIEQGLFSYQSGVTAAQKILALKDRPTAIFAANDEMAAAVISVAHINQLDVPKALSVVGFDDGYLATTITPHLTTIKQPINDMATLAIDIITKESSTSKSKLQPEEYRHVLDFEIIERKSSVKI